MRELLLLLKGGQGEGQGEEKGKKGTAATRITPRSGRAGLGPPPYGITTYLGTRQRLLRS
jgi:hypothetical protein